MHLNPFDLRGPEFLVFYAVLSVIACIAAWRKWRARETGDLAAVAAAATELSQDPYDIAFLRGGRAETLRVAVVSLLERGLLTANGDKIQATRPDAAAHARRPLDKALLTRFEEEGAARLLYTDTIVKGEADVIGEDLRDKRLLPDTTTRSARMRIALATLAVLWGVAGIKIAVALSRGHHNLLFLLLMSLAVGAILWVMANQPRTAFGDQVYERIRLIFAKLRDRRDALQLQHTSSELAFLAAAFGLTALPASTAAVLLPLRLQPVQPMDYTGWSSCGTSCSSSSCGGASSCGGGCGGGCGGCGS